MCGSRSIPGAFLWVGSFNALVDFPVSSTCSILVNLFISYQVYWKTFVNVHNLHVIMIYTAPTCQKILESKSAARTWDPCRPALKQLQLLYTAGANIACSPGSRDYIAKGKSRILLLPD